MSYVSAQSTKYIRTPTIYNPIATWPFSCVKLLYVPIPIADAEYLFCLQLILSGM